MSVVAGHSKLRLDDTVTRATNVVQWDVTAISDSPAGTVLTVTIERTVVGVPPSDPDTLTLSFLRDDGTTISSNTLSVNAVSQIVSFTIANAGTVEMVLRATRSSLGTYDVSTTGTPNTPPALFSSNLDRGWIRGNTTAVLALSNVALGGANNSPASYPDSLFVRITFGAAIYVARSMSVAISGTVPALIGATNSATSGNFDASFPNVVDNRFPISAGSFRASFAVQNAALTGLPAFTVTGGTDAMTVDPRLTIGLQAQKVQGRVAGGNQSAFVISADQLFVWAQATNARGAAVGAITLTDRLKNGTQVIATDSTQVTLAADGWTPAATGIDFTTSVAAPAGNRTQEAFPAAPAGAVGLGTGMQVLGFASAYGLNECLALHVPDEVAPGTALTIVTQFLRQDGVRLPFDAAPSLRVYSINKATGAETDDLAIGPCAQIVATNAWGRAWTPSTVGQYIIEVRGLFAGGGLQGAWPVTARSQFDPIAFAVGDVLVDRTGMT